MYFMTLLCMFIILISLIVMLLTHFLAKNIIENRESNSPFECGFDPMSSSCLPFSLRFFLIAIIFLIFDAEIALILPIPMISSHSNLLMWMSTSMLFIMILLIGLYHEWNQGSLKWAS